MPKHYRPAGKKKEGNIAKYITRTKAVHYLQISLPMFRRLCILKGIFPRVPKKKFEGNHKTYYHTKDINFLLHEPLLEKFREMRTHEKKIRKALAKKNEHRAECLDSHKPTYTLSRLVKERYPKFIDALRDLEDCLSMIHLFAAMPAVGRIDVKRIHNCKRLSHEWQAFISRTHSLRKTFISVKGIFYQAEVQGQTITWLTPHARQQVITNDVDFNVMLTFLEFNETLLEFVNYQLYHSINIKYPPILDPELEAFAADLYALSRYIDAESSLSSQTSKAITSDSGGQAEDVIMGDATDESDQKTNFPVIEAGSLMRLVIGDASTENNEDKETKECKVLFKDCVFFLSREVPKDSLQFVISAFGGVVGWEGGKSPLNETDEQITYQIVDRPTQHHMFLSREYVQPQWVYDCINYRMILPTMDYMVGSVLPPHLSPFVDNEAEGYIPDHAETIKKLQAAAKKHVLPLSGMEDADMNCLAEGIIDRNEAQETTEKMKMLKRIEEEYLQGLAMEHQKYNSSDNNTNNKPVVTSQLTENPSTTNDDQIKEDNDNMSTVSMSRKKRKLYEAMKISQSRKKANVELLKNRKKKAESKEDA
ncbi:putative Pescadillo [Zostera marina]|uniref:Pescadillo homolog n=1 Tax=Zostera marina TaxID=29655 RepID=A0A0K9PM70_ZOSMR|nr:putative Pescadillo [Zostera marina]